MREINGAEGTGTKEAHSCLSEAWGQDEKISSTNPESALTLEGWEGGPLGGRTL